MLFSWAVLLLPSKDMLPVFQSRQYCSLIHKCETENVYVLSNFLIIYIRLWWLITHFFLWCDKSEHMCYCFTWTLKHWHTQADMGSFSDLAPFFTEMYRSVIQCDLMLKRYYEHCSWCLTLPTMVTVVNYRKSKVVQRVTDESVEQKGEEQLVIMLVDCNSLMNTSIKQTNSHIITNFLNTWLG